MSHKGSFQKGYDPRRNTNGRPKAFDTLRQLAQEIAMEEIRLDSKDKKITLVKAILKKWALSGEFDKQKLFLEIAYGKVPDETDELSQKTIRIVMSKELEKYALCDDAELKDEKNKK